MFPVEHRQFPILPEGLMGMGSSGRLVIERAAGKTEETFDFCALLQKMLLAAGHPATLQGDWLVFDAGGLHVHPELLEVSPQDEGGVNTATVIAVAHAGLAPLGVFEFQHALGGNLAASAASGFEGWLALDLPPLLQAVGCHGDLPTLEFSYPEIPTGRRQAVLGNVLHRASHPARVEEAHPFCPCCLLTNCLTAFAEELRRDAFLGIRLLAVRDQDGHVSADCRINGIDFHPGRVALAEYARTWPDRGFEMRKQYIVVRTLATDPL